MRTSRRLIDCCLIKGRLVNAQGTPLSGEIRAWIPGYHRGKRYRVLANGKYKIKVYGYFANREIRLVASSPGYVDLESIVHPHTWIFKKGIFDGFKVVDGGDGVMQLSERIWYAMLQYSPT